ncbi:1,3-beta-glucanosyltransferase [Mycena indigotica]|uniref:1,3-beta-glucanosyltransferase n=1 Tax=Mycena indigotica TaxID=2126181 RepID=A0A8H6RYF7_9AGAR|nr:1,3-beta-glucanosyltransferase [Mycena indigotica]KAF7289228.1 1,3-beta-glucanosyltransferase [Mycena indigotica]
MKLRNTLLPALLASIPATIALPKITRTGRYLYDENGTRFFIKGLAYQTQGIVIPGPDNPLGNPSTYVDNLADSAACARDLPNLQKLGINAIRAYSVDSRLNHDSCMAALSGAGIYVILDLTLPLNGSIDTTLPTWSTNLLNQYIDTINLFNKYDNILAYNVGNEVLTADATNAAPFLKAAARDTKAYLNSIGSSALIGYADIDGASSFRDAVSAYLSCDPSGKNDGSTSIDLFGLNNYAWCGNAPTTTYNTLNDEFKDYNVAAYFSEYGSENCNPGTRPWTEVGTLFATPMSDVWSGGIAFSYFPAAAGGHEFGMATLSSDNKTVTTNADFDNLVSQYGKLTSLPTTPAKSSVPASTFGTCPAENNALEASTTIPPTPNTDACTCLHNKLPCLFKPATSDFNVVLGTLTGVVCSLLGQVGGSCADIGTNGTTGVYGTVASCDPATRLSYAFSQYYELTARAATSCDFAGNATLSDSVKSSPANVVAPSSAVSQCLTSPSAVFTPKASSGAPGPSGSAGGGGGGNGSGGNGGNGGGNGGSNNTNDASVPMRVGVVTVMMAVLGGAAFVLA